MLNVSCELKSASRIPPIFSGQVFSVYASDLLNSVGKINHQGRIQADAWKPGLQRDFFKYGISPGLSEKKL